MNQDSGEFGTIVIEGNNIMTQDGDGDGTCTTGEEKMAPLLPVANIDLSLCLSIRSMPPPGVPEERNLAAIEDAVKHGEDADEKLLANNMDANEDLANTFLQLSLQSRTSISPHKRKAARDGDKCVTHLIQESNMAEDEYNNFLQLSLQTQTTISPRKRKFAQDSNKVATHLIEVSNIDEDGDKSGANLIEGIDMVQEGGKDGNHLIDGNNSMTQDRDASGAPVPEKENIDLTLHLAFDLNMPAPVADTKASGDNTNAIEKTSKDGTDANEDLLRDEMDANKEISPTGTDETGDSMVINTNAPEDAMEQDMATSEEKVHPDTTSYMDSS